MIRTQISLTAEQMGRAKSAADRRGVSLASLLRSALERELAAEPQRGRARALKLRGRYRSGLADVSVDHDEHLASSEARGW